MTRSFPSCARRFGFCRPSSRPPRGAQIPNWAAACIFIAVALTGEWILNAVLATTWPFIALDLAAIGLLGLLIMLRAGAFPHIRQAMTRLRGKAGVTYAAMHLLTLADARVAQPSRAFTKESKVMTIKDIAVFMFSTSEDEAALAAGEALARASDADLAAVLLELQPDPVYTMERCDGERDVGRGAG